MRAASLREKAPILAGLGLLIGALVGLQLTYPEPGLLYLAPALLLLAALAFDRYPGERLLTVLTGRRRPLVSRERSAPAHHPFPLRRSFPRGGVLLAMALAGRGPPA
jgi:hypothetical protein